MTAHDSRSQGTDAREREEQRLQSLADAADAHVDAPDAVRQYRLVARAVRAAPMPPMPAGFAARVARAAADAARADRSRWQWGGIALLGVLLAYGIGSAWTVLGSRLGDLAGGPWPVLLAAGAAVALSSLLERTRSRTHH